MCDTMRPQSDLMGGIVQPPFSMATLPNSSQHSPSVSIVLHGDCFDDDATPPPPPDSYRPGDVVSGTVVIKSDQFGCDDRIDCVRIEVMGTEVAVSYDAEMMGDYRRVSEREICRGEAVAPIVSNPTVMNSGNGVIMVVGSGGVSAVPFRAVLPTFPPAVDNCNGGLPESLDRTSSRIHPESYCCVRYFVRVSALVGTGRSGKAASSSERTIRVVPSSSSSASPTRTALGDDADDGDAKTKTKKCTWALELARKGSSSSAAAAAWTTHRDEGSNASLGSATSSLCLLDVDRTDIIRGEEVTIGVDIAGGGGGVAVPATAPSALRVRIEETTEWIGGGRSEKRVEVLRRKRLALDSEMERLVLPPVSGAVMTSSTEGQMEERWRFECRVVVPREARCTRRDGGGRGRGRGRGRERRRGGSGLISISHNLIMEFEGSGGRGAQSILLPFGASASSLPRLTVPLCVLPVSNDGIIGSGEGGTATAVKKTCVEASSRRHDSRVLEIRVVAPSDDDDAEDFMNGGAGMAKTDSTLLSFLNTVCCVAAAEY